MEINGLIQFIYKHKKRKTGEGYVTHLYAVKSILQEAGMVDSTVLNASLLHDLLEDTQISKEYLAFKFGKRIADIVWVLSKQPIWKTDYCKMKSNLDEMVISQYPEAMIIKMADRLHNLQTIHGFSKNKQEEYLQETKDLLMPLLEQGIQKVYPAELRTCGNRLIQKLKEAIHNIENRN